MRDKKTVWNVRNSVRLLLGTGILGVGISLCSFDSFAAAPSVEVEELIELAAGTDLPAGEVEPMQNQNATVVGGDINIRAAAGTDSDKLAKAPRGTAMIVSGRTTGSDGKIWYQVSLTVDGNAITGFIRSDYAELGDVIPEPEMEEVPETEVPVEPEVEQPQEEKVPYELAQLPMEDGTTEWYLYDKTDPEEQNHRQYLIPKTIERVNDYPVLAKQVEQQKIVIIAMVVVILVLVLGITLLIFKIKDSSMDDEEDEMDFEEAPPVRRKRPINEEGTPVRRTSQGEARPVRRTSQDGDRPVRKSAQEGQSRPKQGSRPAQKTGKKQSGEPARRQVSQGAKQRAAAPKVQEQEISYEEEPETNNGKEQSGAWRSKNFLAEDDEFEFEFLNMDDPNKL